MSLEFALVWRLSLGGARWAREAEGQGAAGAAVVVSILVREWEETEERDETERVGETIEMLYNTDFSELITSLCDKNLFTLPNNLTNVTSSEFKAPKYSIYNN